MGYWAKGLETFLNDGTGVFLKRLFSFGIVRIRRCLRTKKHRKNCGRWKRIRNLKQGKTVFIVGNGPSLNLTPVYLLDGQDTFCFNRFNLMFDRIKWHPTFYMITDDLVVKDMRNELRPIIEETEMSFFPDLHPSNVDFTRYIEDRSNIYWLDALHPDFSMDLPKCGINKTVTNAAIQVAAYLGYDRICFLGVDVDYEKQHIVKKDSRNWTAVNDDDPNHFDKKYFGRGRSYHSPATENMLAKFEDAKQFFEDSGIRFYNVGVGGNLDMFERDSIQGVLGLSNTQIREKFIDSLPETFCVEVVERFLNSSDSKLIIGENGFLTRGIESSQMVADLLKEFRVIGPCFGVYAVYKGAESNGNRTYRSF